MSFGKLVIVTAVAQLAAELEAPERSVRRAIALGAIRSRRLGTRRLRLADGEVDYLRAHWGLLAELRAAMRTEPSVRMAVLFGSVARGDDDPHSDLDLLVEFADESPLDRLRLGIRLQRKVGREVDVASLRQAEKADPFFLLQALEEGRVMVDRGDRWAALLKRRAAIRKRALRSYRRRRRRAAIALEELVSTR